MKKEKEPWTDRFYDDIPVNGLKPRCAYCGDPDVEMDQQFCCENCEYLYYVEADLYWSNREEEYRKKED